MWSRFLLVTFVVTVALNGQAPGNEASLATDLTAAKILYEGGKYADAKSAYEKIIAIAPDNPEANCRLALFACDRGEWEKALGHAGKAIAKDANNARYQYAWGAANGVSALKSGVLSKVGYARRCLAAYQRAAEIEPNNPQYHFALMSYYQQAPGIVGGDMAKAYDQAAAIRKLDERQGRQAYVQLYVAEKKYDLAFREFDEQLAKSPDDMFVLYQFGRLTQMSAQRLEEGLAAYRRCIVLAPAERPAASRADLHWRVGSVLEQLGKQDEARAEYEVALKEAPEFRPARRAVDKLDGKKA